MTEQTTTRTVAEIEAELQAAKEAERERKLKEEQELRLARRREELTLTNAYMEKLRETLVGKGVEASLRPGRVGEYGNMYYATLEYLEGSDAENAGAEPRLERRSGGYGASDSYQIQLGSYGDRKTYPRLKDGTFNYEKIATELAEFIKRRTAQRKLREQQEQAYKVSCKLEDQLEKEFPDCTTHIRATSQPDAVTIKFERALSVEQAREILSVIQRITAKRTTLPASSER